MKTLAYPMNPNLGIRRQLQDWWLSLPALLRSPVWPATLAALMALFLLLAFHQVVRQAVQQGEVLRMATATHSEAVWRCASLRGLRMRESCLAQMNEAPNAEGSVQNTATVTKVAHRGR